MLPPFVLVVNGSIVSGAVNTAFGRVRGKRALAKFSTLVKWRSAMYPDVDLDERASLKPQGAMVGLSRRGDRADIGQPNLNCRSRRILERKIELVFSRFGRFSSGLMATFRGLARLRVWNVEAMQMPSPL